jgi:hypothetical protein
MWIKLFLFLAVIGYGFWGGIWGLHSDFERKEVIEIETPNDVEWSFQRKDFVLTPQEQAPVPTEKYEKDNEIFNDAENLPAEMVTEKEKESSPEIHSPEIQRQARDFDLTTTDKHNVEGQRRVSDSNLTIAKKYEEDNEFFNDAENIPAEIVTKN